MLSGAGLGAARESRRVWQRRAVLLAPGRPPFGPWGRGRGPRPTRPDRLRVLV